MEGSRMFYKVLDNSGKVQKLEKEMEKWMVPWHKGDRCGDKTVGHVLYDWKQCLMRWGWWCCNIDSRSERLKPRKAVEVRDWCVKAWKLLSSPGGTVRGASQRVASWVDNGMAVGIYDIWPVYLLYTWPRSGVGNPYSIGTTGFLFGLQTNQLQWSFLLNEDVSSGSLFMLPLWVLTILVQSLSCLVQ